MKAIQLFCAHEGFFYFLHASFPSLLLLPACFYDLNRNEALLPGQVTGHLITSEGEQASDARIRISGRSFAQTTDLSGDFLIRNLTAGRWLLRFDYDGPQEKQSAARTVLLQNTEHAEGWFGTSFRLEGIDLGSIQLSAGESITGLVEQEFSGQNSRPAAGAWVVATVIHNTDDALGFTYEEALTTADSNGYYSFENIVGDEVRVAAFMPNNPHALSPPQVLSSLDSGFAAPETLLVPANDSSTRQVRLSFAPEQSPEDKLFIEFVAVGSSPSTGDFASFTADESRFLRDYTNPLTLENVIPGRYDLYIHSSSGKKGVTFLRVIHDGDTQVDFGLVELHEEAQTDAGLIVTPDAGLDAGLIVTPDAGLDAGLIVTPDAGLDAGLVVTPDAGLDAGLPLELDIVQVSAGEQHTCALLADQRVMCWGRNNRGQLGNGSLGIRASHWMPRPVLEINDATSISAGALHTCAIVTDGKVKCWGLGSNGALGFEPAGTDVLDSRPVPVEVQGLQNIKKIKAGSGSTCALSEAGVVSCWGNNADPNGNRTGVLGEFTDFYNPSPVLVSVPNAIDISIKLKNACAVTTLKDVYCWGAEIPQPDPNGNFIFASSGPVKIEGIGPATGVSVSFDHTCATLESGGVSCWGERGLLGIDSNSPAGDIMPSQVLELTDVVQVTAARRHSCALFDTGEVKCWGENDSLQMGDGSAESPRLKPSPAGEAITALLSPASSISAYRDHTCAVLTDNSVYCWGSSDNGKRGNRSDTQSPMVPNEVLWSRCPTDNTYDDDVNLETECISYTTCMAGSYIMSIGDDLNDRQCALCETGFFTDSENSFQCIAHTECTELAVAGTSTTDNICVQSPRQIVAGWDYTCELKNTQVYCWGANYEPTTPVSDSGVPRLMWMSPEPIALSGGYAHACALLSDGSARCWGANTQYELGDGTTSTTYTPAVVKGADGTALFNIAQISAGASYTCARLNSGEIKCWGLDILTYQSVTAPTSINESNGNALIGTLDLATGGSHACALLASGTEVYCWGDQSNLKLGSSAHSPPLPLV